MPTLKLGSTPVLTEALGALTINGAPTITDLSNVSGTLVNSVQDNITRLGTVASGTIGNGVIVSNGILKASSTSYFRFISGSDDTDTVGGGSPSGWYITVANNYTSTADNNVMVTYYARCRWSAHYTSGTIGSVWDGSAHDPFTTGVHNGTYLTATTSLSGSSLQLNIQNTYSGSTATRPLTYTILVAANFDLS
ncbi:uncharacterized protein METZ01_LOCUS180739 [marine metagenome]|uniref:Uncharacterized protein n=1 Tax=marine metagenome TaxID=408172 RepID=A0A382CP79_9ZZZZ